MAGDIRDPLSNSNPTPPSPPPGATSPPPHVQSQTPKIYEIFPNSNSNSIAPESANALPPGSGLNTAGARGDVSLSKAWTTVRWQDFSQVHMYPCVREAGLQGLISGFAVGGLRGLLGASMVKSCNWAVGSLIFVSAASYEWCGYRRKLEKAYMKRAVEIIDTKKVQKEKELERKRKERREAKEQTEREEEEKRRRSWWRVW